MDITQLSKDAVVQDIRYGTIATIVNPSVFLKDSKLGWRPAVAYAEEDRYTLGNTKIYVKSTREFLKEFNIVKDAG